MSKRQETRFPSVVLSGNFQESDQMPFCEITEKSSKREEEEEEEVEHMDEDYNKR